MLPAMFFKRAESRSSCPGNGSDTEVPNVRGGDETSPVDEQPCKLDCPETIGTCTTGDFDCAPGDRNKRESAGQGRRG